MKKGFLRVVLLLLISAGVYFFFSPKKPEPKINPPAAQNLPASQTEILPARTAATAPPVISSPAPAQPPPLAAKAGEVIHDTTPPPNVPPEAALRSVERSVRQYGKMFGGNPVGTNPEITSQLNGNNPRHINFIDAQAGLRINQNGELIDDWGTPYFFHQLSGAVMEIHSAGPDKIMWTSDDLVIK